jgi:hypothetical protein
MESSGKLESKWEGPYIVIEKTRPGAYHLMDPQGLKLECRQSLLFLCLTFCKDGGLTSYK